MKKLAVIIGGVVLLVVVVLAVAGLWAKAHLQEIVQSATGMDLTFASLNLTYSPIPTITLTDLSVAQGQNKITVPRLKLYPDLTKILSGRVSIRKAVLEEPLVVAGLGDGRERAGPDAQGGGTPLSMDAIPDGVVVVKQGKLLVQSPQGQALPVSVTAKAEKSDQRLSVRLDSASIDEIGLRFAGQVSIASFTPLKLSIEASEGAFNPSAVKDFLLKFGYIKQTDADRIPAIEKIDAKGLKLQFNAGSGQIDLLADRLDVDQVALRTVSVKLADGAFQVSCANGTVDAHSVYGWLLQQPDTKTMMEDVLAQAKLKQLTPQGTIGIAALQFQGNNKAGENQQATDTMNGAVDLSVKGLILELVGTNDQQQRLTISQLESRVEMQKGKPTVTVGRLKFKSSEGGSGDITGQIPLPLDFRQTTLKSAIKGLRVFDTTLDLHLNKGEHPKTAFTLDLNAPSLKVAADGHIFAPGRNKTDLEARLTHLRIAAPKSERPSETPDGAAQNAALTRPFDTKTITERDLSAKAFVKTFQYEGLPRLKDVDLQFKSAGKQALLQGSVRMCGVKLSVGAVGLPQGRVAATLETKGTDLDLTSLIACFSNELPVYLAGRVYLNASFGTDGNTPQQLIDGAEGEISVIMTRAVVKRLSGLDPRLGFFLDILQAAGIRSEQMDSIDLSRAVVNANLSKGRLVVDRFTLVGPNLSAWGSGEFTLSDKRLLLSGGVKTVLGVRRPLDIDRILGKEGV